MRWLLILVLVVQACGDSPVDPSDEIAGDYALRTVNGSTLPFLFQDVGTSKSEILGDTISLAATGGFTQHGTLRLTQSGLVNTQSYVGTGTYTRDGIAVVFRATVGGTTVAGTLENATITIVATGFSYVYSK